MDAREDQVSASGGSRACNATLRIDKILAPSDDLGRFNLEIDGSVAGSGGNVGNQGTTGDVFVAALPTGSVHTVGERPLPGTKADDYDTTIVCRAGGGGGAELGSSNTPSLAIKVSPRDALVCTISNTRRGGTTPIPPIPGPEPPIPEPQPPIPPFPTPPDPQPPGNQIDLAITKVANPQTITIGSTYTVTARVTNNGGATATNVTVTELISLGTALLSAMPSQGSCSAATRSCNLGTLAPGASATITGVVRGQVIGARVNAIEVHAAESDPDLTDNVASALVHVVGPTVCGRLKLNRRTAVLGQRFTLSAQTRTVRRTPVWGLNVQLRGAGVSGAKTTNRYGTAAFSVTPRRPGLLVVTVGRSNRCSGAIGVLGKSTPGVSG